MNAIEIKGLCKSYKDFRIDGLNLTLPGGCVVGLVGENGAGKSTTIKLILNLIKKDAGTINVLGRDNVKELKQVSDSIGVVFDECCFPQELNAIQLGKILRNLYSKWDDEKYFELLQRFDLPLKKKIKSFSRGMKMKISIAAAMSHNASLLILDEATSGLDPVVRDEIVDMLMDFTKEEDHSILISSHIVSDLEKLCDYIAFMHKGRLMLFEEKDRLSSEYGLVFCSDEQFGTLPVGSVLGMRRTEYGTEAVMRKSDIPQGFRTSEIDIEKLFIYMSKGEN